MNYRKRHQDLKVFLDSLYWFGRCDVILSNEEQIMGIVYRNGNKKKPHANIGYSWSLFKYFIFQVATVLGIPCIENKLLVKAIFDDGKISKKYLPVFETIYDKLTHFINKRDGLSFQEQLQQDIEGEKHYFGYRYFKKIVYKNLRSFRNSSCHEIDDFENEILKLAQSNNFEINRECNTKLIITSFFLKYYEETENIFDVNKPDFWLMVFMCGDSVYVGNQYFFQYFESNEKVYALDLITKIIESRKNFCYWINKQNTEFDISQNDYESVLQSFKKILSENYKHYGIRYGYNVDKTVLIAFLENQRNQQRVYKIAITYKQFLKNSEAFKQMIENSHISNKWNFPCEEIAYKENYFEKIIT
ncbi:MAG: hypothetical protein IKX70_02045 [Treponema sp.]|nr:hypothetical protein [Treponema sp.]